MTTDAVVHTESLMTDDASALNAAEPCAPDAPPALVDADPAEIAERRARRRAAEHQQHVAKVRAAIRGAADNVIAHRSARWGALPLRIASAPEHERVRVGIAGSLAPLPSAAELSERRRERVAVLRRVYARLGSAETVTPGALDVLVDELIDDAERRPGAYAQIALGDEHTLSDDLADHAFAVGALALAIGIALGWSRADVRAAGLAGFLADVGSMLAPQDVRHLERPLNEIEINALHRHPAWSAGLLELIRAQNAAEALPESVQIAVWQHHERLDGSGYPTRVRGERVHDLARVVAAADVLAGLCAPRAHRPALSREQALGVLVRQATAGALDRNAVRAVVAIVGSDAARGAQIAQHARAA